MKYIVRIDFIQTAKVAENEVTENVVAVDMTPEVGVSPVKVGGQPLVGSLKYNTEVELENSNNAAK